MYKRGSFHFFKDDNGRWRYEGPKAYSKPFLTYDECVREWAQYYYYPAQEPKPLDVPAEDKAIETMAEQPQRSVDADIIMINGSESA